MNFSSMLETLSLFKGIIMSKSYCHPTHPLHSVFASGKLAGSTGLVDCNHYPHWSCEYDAFNLGYVNGKSQNDTLTYCRATYPVGSNIDIKTHRRIIGKVVEVKACKNGNVVVVINENGQFRSAILS